MIINHCHVFPEGTLNREHPELGTLPALKKFMKECGVEKAVAFAPSKTWMPRDTFYQLKIDNPNEWLYQSLKQYKNIYGVIAGDPKERNACKVLQEYAKKGFIGVKIHPPCLQIKIDDPAYEEYYGMCEELGLFVIFHTGVHGWRLDQYEPRLIDNVAYKHPNLNIIIEHMGTPYHFDQAMAVIYNSKFFNGTKVYAGLTGMVSNENKPKIIQLVKIIGSDRIIYGLDFPCLSLSKDYPKNTQPVPPDRSSEVFKEHLRILYSLGFDKKDLDNILGGNLAKLIK